MKGPYVNEDGDLWIERGDVSWNRAQHEARGYLVGEMEADAIRYVGKENDTRVSDEIEYVHMDDDGCADADDVDLANPPKGWKPCCRTANTYHFEAVYR